MSSLLVAADARSLPLAETSIDVVVTSPPYFGQRRYGDSRLELGVSSLDDYLAEIVELGEELARVLRPCGVVWLVLGDTASGSGGAGGDWRGDKKRGAARPWRPGPTGLRAQQWALVPSRVALSLQDAGWLIRASICWDKDVARPEDLRRARRPGVSSETILLLARNHDYRFFAERLVERGNVWHVGPHRGVSTSLAPYPDEIAERAILASSEPGDVVLDPFDGSGTTRRVASSLGRRSIGADLYVTEHQKLKSQLSH